jgi:hypothetical protein
MPTPERPALTDRQAECLAIFRQHWIEHGCSPTLLVICRQMGMWGSSEGAMSHIRALMRKGYLRAVAGYRGGTTRKDGQSSRAYILTDNEIVVKRKGGRVRVAMTGPDVVMSREEWRKWLQERWREV